jgi:hypothetical protein
VNEVHALLHHAVEKDADCLDAVLLQLLASQRRLHAADAGCFSAQRRKLHAQNPQLVFHRRLRY